MLNKDYDNYFWSERVNELDKTLEELKTFHRNWLMHLNGVRLVDFKVELDNLKFKHSGDKMVLKIIDAIAEEILEGGWVSSSD